MPNSKTPLISEDPLNRDEMACECQDER
jgi:hypothetical protein